jgi:hypothetical protein
MPLLPTLPSAVTWRILLAFGALSVFLAAVQGFTVDLRTLGLAALIVTPMLVIAHVYTHRRPEPQYAIPAILIVYFIANGLIFGPMSYFAAALGGPLMDAQLAAIDRWMGFDWHAVQRLTAGSELLSWAGVKIYHNSGYQMLLAWAVLAVTGQHGRLTVFLTALVVSTGACVLLSAAIPAAGAYIHYNVPDSALGHLAGTGAGVWHMTDFEALRAGTLRALDLQNLEGIVTFPSFHTVVALLSGWSLARTRYLAVPAALYSGLVVLTTIPIGGHYLIDVIFGGLITAAALAVSAWVNKAETSQSTHAPIGTDRAPIPSQA